MFRPSPGCCRRRDNEIALGESRGLSDSSIISETELSTSSRRDSGLFSNVFVEGTNRIFAINNCRSCDPDKTKAPPCTPFVPSATVSSPALLLRSSCFTNKASGVANPGVFVVAAGVLVAAGSEVEDEGLRAGDPPLPETRGAGDIRVTSDCVVSRFRFLEGC